MHDICVTLCITARQSTPGNDTDLYGVQEAFAMVAMFMVMVRMGSSIHLPLARGRDLHVLHMGPWRASRAPIMANV